MSKHRDDMVIAELSFELGRMGYDPYGTSEQIKMLPLRGAHRLFIDGQEAMQVMQYMGMADLAYYDCGRGVIETDKDADDLHDLFRSILKVQ